MRKIILFFCCTIALSLSAQHNKKGSNKSKTILFRSLDITINDLQYNLSSKDSVYTRNYEGDVKPKKIRIILTQKEKELIYKKALEVGFYSMPYYLEDNGISISGTYPTELSLVVDKKRKSVTHPGCCVKDEKMEKKFYEFLSFILIIIESRKEVQALPPSDVVLLL